MFCRSTSEGFVSGDSGEPVRRKAVKSNQSLKAWIRNQAEMKERDLSREGGEEGAVALRNGGKSSGGTVSEPSNC